MKRSCIVITLPGYAPKEALIWTYNPRYLSDAQVISALLLAGLISRTVPGSTEAADPIRRRYKLMVDSGQARLGIEEQLPSGHWSSLQSIPVIRVDRVNDKGEITGHYKYVAHGGQGSFLEWGFFPPRKRRRGENAIRRRNPPPK